MLETVVLATRSYALMVELADASLFFTGNTGMHRDISDAFGASGEKYL